MFPHPNLQSFLADLERAGEVRRIRQPVSAHLEISRITDEASKSPGGGPALIFENVKNASFAATTNVFGSDRRICMALGVSHLDELAERIRSYLQFSPPSSLRQALQALPMALDLPRFVPRRYTGTNPPCQQVVTKGDAVDLRRLPVLHCWPKDAGPFVTLPLVFTRSLESGRRNVGMYRLQVYDRNTTGMHWHIHKDGSHYFNEYRKANRRMPVAVAIGADPASVYSATAPMPQGIDEMLLAGFIRRRPVRMAQCVSIDMQVPAEAEFVLEGYVDPKELRREGPFGDHTGYYSLADDYPVFHVTAITHRRHPVYHATLVGPPPMEDCYLAKATERIFLPMLQSVLPEIIDYWFPWEGVFHNIVFVSIRKEYPGHAHKVMSALWGQGQMSFCKTIVVVDESVNPQNAAQVFETLLEQFDPHTDLTRTQGVLDVLDHASPHPTFGSKLGIDLTARFPGEPPRHVPAERPMQTDIETVCRQVQGAIPEVRACRMFPTAAGTHANRLLAVAVEKSAARSGQAIAEALLAHEKLAGFNLMVLFEARMDLDNHSRMLWKLFNNVDPARDLVASAGRVAIDACPKGPVDGHLREWPDELTFDV